MSTSNIFTMYNVEDTGQKINIDELFEGSREKALEELALFNRILSRIHAKIKISSRQKMDNKSCWFTVPEIIIGAASYNCTDCIAYVVNKLNENGFKVKYYHPNVLFIVWNHYVPSYVRTEIKKKYGVNMNEMGEEIPDKPKTNPGMGNRNSRGAKSGATSPSNSKTFRFEDDFF
jgi:hypothetical protein